jgi:hypothetical protein
LPRISEAPPKDRPPTPEFIAALGAKNSLTSPRGDIIWRDGGIAVGPG